MLTTILSELYERDLNKLRQEIEQYPDDASLWKKAGEIPNSGGNLCLHLCGNLRHFIARVIGESGYVRDRDAEFSRTEVSREELLAEIDATILDVKNGLAKCTQQQLDADYPIEVFGKPMRSEERR